jgi:hypothetical protein
MERLDLFLPFIGNALLIGLVVIFVRRRLYRKYSFFFGYIVFTILAAIVLFFASSNYQLYFKVFWATEAFDALFALLALYEAFHDVFRLDYRDWPWFWMVFPGAVAILSVIFIGNALLHPPAQAPPLIALILSFATVVNCVKGGLFLMFLALAWLLMGESWPTYPYGVVVGFAVSAGGSLLSYWLRSIFGTEFNSVAKYGPPVSYILAVLIWIASCFLPPEPRNRWASFNDPEKTQATVRQYLKALKRIAGKD